MNTLFLVSSVFTYIYYRFKPSQTEFLIFFYSAPYNLVHKNFCVLTLPWHTKAYLFTSYLRV